MFINEGIERGRFALATVDEQRIVLARRIEDCHMAVAQSYFEEYCGMHAREIQNAMKAIDFGEPVEVVDVLSPPTGPISPPSPSGPRRFRE